MFLASCDCEFVPLSSPDGLGLDVIEATIRAMIITNYTGHGPVRFRFGTFGAEPEPEHYVRFGQRLNLNLKIRFGSASGRT